MKCHLLNGRADTAGRVNQHFLAKRKVDIGNRFISLHNRMKSLKKMTKEERVDFLCKSPNLQATPPASVSTEYIGVENPNHRVDCATRTLGMREKGIGKIRMNS
jgi:hypothetical protein